MDRLYIVVRQDLRPGDVLCQAVHAAIEYCLRYVGRAALWHDIGGNNVVILGVADGFALAETLESLRWRGFAKDVVEVYEPDLGDVFTAFAVGDRARPWLSHLPLALRARNAESAMA